MANLFIGVGRVRVTKIPSPSEAGYIRAMRAQAKGIADIIQGVFDKTEDIMPEALVYGLKPAFERSQELVPVLTGKLKHSGFLESDVTRSGNARAILGYGRFGVPHYAAFVHEMLHIRRAPGKSAKYLEYAVNEKADLILPRVEQYLQRQIGLK